MRVFLVRHGQTIWNAAQRWQGRTDIPLDAVGFMQAQKLAEKMTHYPIQAIYSSPLQRAAATAKAVSEKLNLPITYRDDLREICLGEWEGKTFKEISAQYADAIAVWNANPYAQVGFGVESNGHLQQRACCAFEAICEQEEGDTLVVTHGGWINRLICKLLHIPMEHRLCFELLNTGLTIVNCEKESDTHKNTVITLNDVSHLQ